ncbi:MAG: 3 4-dihydroxy 2-butanone 4-phosphate synthase / GTP cyclohydrolase II [Rhodospirillaceae bacterium]|nr:MAG: 3 4-dihydroxy 2-butanone 4-phosphate synthase / GTP cyclohydrolase II [Rhodospirillaceae bacterium]
MSMTRRLFSLSSPLGTSVADGVRGVDHAVCELRRGGYVVLFPATEEKDPCVVQAAEAVTPHSLDVLTRLALGHPPVLVLTLRRAVASGLIAAAANVGENPVSVVQVAAGLEAGRMLALAQPGAEPFISPEEMRGASLVPGQGVLGAAVRLAKLARLLPAAVVGTLSKEGSADPVMMGRGRVLVADVLAYDMRIVHTLRPVSEARVPLDGAENVRLIAFRPGDGGLEHLAIIVGAPKAETPVLVRLHSECFTGDLLGSLRCDCGNQLRGAITAMAEAG